MEHVTSCLLALYTLLESPFAKEHIAEDQVNTECTNIRKTDDVGRFRMAKHEREAYYEHRHYRREGGKTTFSVEL